MENYFQYFSEIEEHFQRRRGTTLLLSTLDWALIESWKEQAIPLEAVLRGIDAAFEKFEQRPRKGRKVNSLAYCTQAVMESAEQMGEAALGAERTSSPAMPADEIAKFLKANAEALRAQKDTALARVAGEIAASLSELAGAMGDSPARLEEIERRLTVLEEKLLAALVSATPEAELVALRAEAEGAIAPYAREMRGAQLEQLRKQYVQKRLLEKRKLPRLSLFYMR
jgi:hypothetical protein